MRVTSPGAGATLAARAVLLVALVHFATGPLLRPLVHPYAYSDFATFFTAARSFSAHEDPYDPNVLRQSAAGAFDGWIGGYYYPPPFAAVVVRPLAAVPFAIARRLWVLFEALSYLAALALLARRLPGPWVVRAAVLAVLGLVFAPIDLDLKLGSVSGLLLLLVALFLDAWHRGRRQGAALALAGAVLLKVSPALVVAYLLVRGEWRFALRTAATGLGLVLLALPATGIDAWRVWLTHVVPYLATANFSWFTNQSIDAFFWRLLVPNPDTTPWIGSPLLQRWATWIVSAGLVLLLGLVARRARRAPPGGTRFDTEIGLVLVITVLLSRVAWEYLVVLAVPAFAVGALALGQGTAGRREALGLGLAWALCALPFPYAAAPPRAGLALLLAAPRTYGMLLLAGITARRLLRLPREPAPVESPRSAG
jgi:Glycosyltransferase family 87